MDLLQLEHFLAVVEEGTFTRAAERVSRTQPAVSQSIKKLEEEIGGQLFARDLHDVSLTEAGKTSWRVRATMVRARDDAMRRLGALKTLKTGTLKIAAHESAAVYLLPAPLRNYLSSFPDVKIGIYRSPLAEIPRQVMDREVHVGFVKDEPGFHELQCVEVHADEMMLVAAPTSSAGRAPRHPRSRSGRRALRRPSPVQHDRTEDPAAVRTAPHAVPDRRRAVELREHQELRPGGGRAWPSCPASPSRRSCATARWSTFRSRELDMPRRTLMIYREQGYLSQSARELIKIVRSFNWDSKVIPTNRRSATAGSRAAAGLKSPRSA